MNRRTKVERVLALCLALVLILGTVPALAGTEETGEITLAAEPAEHTLAAAEDSTGFAEQFDNAVDSLYSIWTRWWIMGMNDYHTAETIEEEIRTMAEAGITLIEVNNQNFLWTDTKAEIEGDGATSYLDVFYWICKYADQYGVAVDWTTGDMYPAIIPQSSAYYSDDIRTYKWDWDTIDVAGGLTGEPLTTANLTRNKEVIEAVTAVYTADGKNVQAALDLTDTSYVSLASDKKSGTITVTDSQLTALAGQSLSGGSWQVFTFYSVYDTSGGIDYLDADATRAWANHWEYEILGSSYLADKYGSDLAAMGYGSVTDLFESVSENFWEDSLESFTINYTDGIFDAFEEVNGYEFPKEMLPMMIVGGRLAWTVSYSTESSGGDYIYDKTADKQLRNDYYTTLSELYNENHLGEYLKYAESHGMGTRVQASYNYTLDQDSAMAYVTIAENETLNAQNSLDVYRSYSGGAHVNGVNIISSEAGANSEAKSFITKWSDWLWYFNMEFAGGVNQSVLHGVDNQYSTWGTNTWAGRSGAQSTPGQGESMGQRMPYFTLMEDTISSYLAREQFILQQGLASSDLAIYYYAFDYGLAGDSGRDYLSDESMQDAGYTYEFLGDSSLQLAQGDSDGGVAFYSDGELTAEYKALVINQYRTTDQGFDLQGVMPVETAEKILELAQAGTNVFIIGDAPDKSASYGDNVDTDGDARVQAIMNTLLGMDNVYQVATEAAMVDALAAADISAASAYDDSAAGDSAEDLLTYHRQDEHVDYYFFFNSSYTANQMDEPLQMSRSGSSKSNTASEAHSLQTYVELEGEGTPYLLDCWTGEISRIADYTVTEDGKYRVYIELDASETTMIAIGTPDWYTDGLGSGVKTVTEADVDVVYDNGSIYATSDSTGSYSVTLSDGTVKSAQVDAVPDDISLTDGNAWTLALTLYEPGDEFKNGNYSGINSYIIEKPETETVTTTELKAWKDMNFTYKTGGAVTGRGISGIGVYETQVDIPADYDPETMGYVLDLEWVTELFVVYVNGEKVIFDQTKGSVDYTLSGDISPYLQAGQTNTIQIEVASGLFNAMQYFHLDTTGVLSGGDWGNWQSSDGILGDVALKGYTRVLVDEYVEAEYTVSASANTGGTAVGGTYAHGSDAEVTVTADDGYKLLSLLVDGVTQDISDFEGTYTIENIQSDHVVRALFVQDGVEFAERFDDVNTDDWFYDEVNTLTGLVVVRGVSDNEFQPDRDTTRAEFAQLMFNLAEVLGLNPVENSNIPFTDMPMDDYWATGVIGWAYTNGVVEGYSDTEFGPEDPISREDMALAFYRFLAESQGYQLEGDTEIEFADADEMQDWAEDAVAYVVRTGLMQGYEDDGVWTFKPQESTIRSEIATLFYNYLVF